MPGSIRRRISAHDGPVQSIAWHPQRDALLTTGQDGAVRLWDNPFETAQQLIAPSASWADHACWSASGERAAVAIGARAREVLLQFLVEAVTLSCIGGVTGIAVAYGLCSSLAKVVGAPFLFDPKINIIAFVFSAAIGIIFGFMPARRAAGLDPIEALRHE